jgi:hypothetical protein
MEEVNIRACHTGLMPEPDIEMEDIPNLVNIDEEEDDEEPKEPHTGEDAMEDRNCIFMMTIPCEAEFVHTSLNISLFSQHLAEAFHKSVPSHLHDFE